jgi:hypothetical protein
MDKRDRQAVVTRLNNRLCRDLVVLAECQALECRVAEYRALVVLCMEVPGHSNRNRPALGEPLCEEEDRSRIATAGKGLARSL